jgi:hypothetical protein
VLLLPSLPRQSGDYCDSAGVVLVLVLVLMLMLRHQMRLGAREVWGGGERGRGGGCAQVLPVEEAEEGHGIVAGVKVSVSVSVSVWV